MPKLTRKQREVAQRENLFLDIARRLLLDHGYHGLTMARVAEIAEYSKGTIYLHFSCKEEMIIALVTRGMERRLEMMERAAAFVGRPRERLVALGEAIEFFSRLYPDDMRIFFISNTETIAQKVSEDTLMNMRRCSSRTFALVGGIVRDAVARGDLALSPGTSPEQVAFAMRALVDGAHAATWSWMPPREMGIDNPLGLTKDACLILCDGYGWRPLSEEWDYEDTRRRVWEQVFPAEAQRAAVN